MMQTFTGWMRALLDAPGTCPPVPSHLDLTKLEDNGWIERAGEGWRVTKSARVALRFPKPVEA